MYNQKKALQTEFSAILHILIVQTPDTWYVYRIKSDASFSVRMWTLTLSDNRNVWKRPWRITRSWPKSPGEQSISIVCNWHKSYVLANVIQAGNACQFPSGVTVTAVARPFQSFLRGKTPREREREGYWRRWSPRKHNLKAVDHPIPPRTFLNTHG